MTVKLSENELLLEDGMEMLCDLCAVMMIIACELFGLFCRRKRNSFCESERITYLLLTTILKRFSGDLT